VLDIDDCSIAGKGLICCGDNKGTLWMYHLPYTDFGLEQEPGIVGRYKARARLCWPDPEDGADNTINAVCVSHDNAYIVAVTSSNTVVIYTNKNN
jgi:hypothetical protein